MRKFLPVALTFAALALLLPAAVRAQGGPGVVLTDRYVLDEGQVIEGDLLVAAPVIILQAGSRVTGNVALLGETIIVQGQVGGCLAVLSDSVTLGAGASIGSDASLCADSIRRDDRAVIGGVYSASCDRVGDLIGEVAPLAFDPSRWTWRNFDPAAWDLGRFHWMENIQPPQVSPAQRLGLGIAWALGIGGLASLYALIFPQSLRRISDAALSAPIASGGVGLLALVLSVVISGVVAVSLILIVTVIFVPLAALLWLALIMLMLIGWAAFGLPTGTWLLARFGVRRASPMAATAIGTTLLTLLLGLLCISDVGGLLACGVVTLLGSWGMGAAILTQLGRYRYPAAPAQ